MAIHLDRDGRVAEGRSGSLALAQHLDGGGCLGGNADRRAHARGDGAGGDGTAPIELGRVPRDDVHPRRRNRKGEGVTGVRIGGRYDLTVDVLIMSPNGPGKGAELSGPGEQNLPRYGRRGTLPSTGRCARGRTGSEQTAQRESGHHRPAGHSGSHGLHPTSRSAVEPGHCLLSSRKATGL